MDDLVSKLNVCSMNKTTKYHQILVKMLQLDPYIDRRILTPVILTNLEHILTQTDLIKISNICMASMFYKKLFPTKRFAPIVLKYIKQCKLPAFFFVFYCFFDSLTESERKIYFYDVELLNSCLFHT